VILIVALVGVVSGEILIGPGFGMGEFRGSGLRRGFKRVKLESDET